MSTDRFWGPDQRLYLQLFDLTPLTLVASVQIATESKWNRNAFLVVEPLRRGFKDDMKNIYGETIRPERLESWIMHNGWFWADLGGLNYFFMFRWWRGRGRRIPMAGCISRHKILFLVDKSNCFAHNTGLGFSPELFGWHFSLLRRHNHTPILGANSWYVLKLMIFWGKAYWI